MIGESLILGASVGSVASPAAGAVVFVIALIVYSVM